MVHVADVVNDAAAWLLASGRQAASTKGTYVLPLAAELHASGDLQLHLIN
jgi:hypothetical protein